jgi:hypothetical protein
MNPAFIISMYNEHTTVFQSILEIKSKFPESLIVIEHSDNENENGILEEIKKRTNYHKQYNLGKVLPWRILHAQSLARNYSHGFNVIYNKKEKYDLIICMLGDALVTDASNFSRRYVEMKEKNLIAFVSQAIGMYFIESEYDMSLEASIGPPQGKRLQHSLITDFMPQLFLIDGDFAYNNKPFSKIKITNRYTSEQCLGDELFRFFDTPTNYHKRIGKLATSAFGYNDGVILQYIQ